MKKISKLSILFLLLKIETSFSAILPISAEVASDMSSKGTYSTNCPVPPSRLRLVSFSYYDFDGVEHNDGEIVVMDSISNNVEKIFENLYEIQFPIAKAGRMEHYGGDDELSLKDNNTSSFNCRLSSEGSGFLSVHAYGLALDINPKQNPYVQQVKGQYEEVKVIPDEGVNYLNRSNQRQGMVEEIVSIFSKHGFRVWGGKWNDPIDWQHFQVSRLSAVFMAAMTEEDAIEFFDFYSKQENIFDRIAYTTNQVMIDQILDLYRKNSAAFMGVLHDDKQALIESNSVEHLYNIFFDNINK